MRSLAAILTATLLLAFAGVVHAEGMPAVRMARLRTGVLLAAGKAPAKKAKEAHCDVLEFHATKTGTKSIDAKLERWKNELDQPPLSAFDSFKVTSAKSVTIEPNGTASAQVTASLTLLFKGVVNENDKDRLQLEITIDNAKGKRMYRSTTTQDSGASQILSAGKSGEANVFFVVTCTAQ